MPAATYILPSGKSVSRHEWPLFRCCSALHGTVCGSEGDNYALQDLDDMRAFVRARLSDWYEESRWAKYDWSVFRLCQEALLEYDRWRATIGRPQKGDVQ